MKKNKIIWRCSISILVLILTIIIIFVDSANTIYISINGSKKYNCNGQSDQKTINKALNYIAKNSQYTTVYIKGAGSCIIDEPILMPNNTKLKGDSSVLLKLKDNAKWPKLKPIIGQRGVSKWTVYGDENSTISNIEIAGFQITGGVQSEPTGTTYLPLIHFYNPINIKIHNMSLNQSKWDIIRFTGSNIRKSINSKIYNNEIRDSGHEGVCFVNVTDFEIYDNSIYSTRTNCGIRVKNSNKFSIHGNIIGNSLGKRVSGYAGILIENKNSPIESAKIFNNLIYGKAGGVILDAGEGNYKRTGVHIYNNIIYHIKHLTISYNNQDIDLDGGIRIDGFNNTLIENNIIEGSSRDGIIYEGKKSSKDSYKTTVRDNIIINNQRYGINNSEKSKHKHKFILEKNLLYNNKTNYINTSSTTDIYKKPLFSKSHSIKNHWHHIVITYDSNIETIAIYIDGEKRVEKRYVGFGILESNSDDLFVGGYRGIAHWFNGKIKLTIWNSILDSKKIKTLYQNSIKKGIDDNLIGKKQFDLKTTLIDKSNRFIKYKSNLLFKSDFTISAWIYPMTDSTSSREYQTILNKGRDGDKNYIWVYIREDTIFAKIVNRGKYLNIDSTIIDLKNIFHLELE